MFTNPPVRMIERVGIAFSIIALLGLGFLTVLPAGAALNGATTSVSSTSPTSDLVMSVDQNGNQINGYYTVLYNSGGNEMSSGFTPFVLTGMSYGQTYEVQVDNFGSCTFSHWQDTGSSDNPRTFTFTQTASGLTFEAVYNCGTTTTTTTTTSTVATSNGLFQVTFVQANSCPAGTEEAGSWIIPWAVSLSDGQSASQPAGQVSRAENASLGYIGTTNSSYSTITFQLLSGKYSFTVQPSSLLTPASSLSYFSSTGQPVTETIDFRPASCGPVTTTGQSSTLTVQSGDQNNDSISGYYTVLYSSSGSVVSTGFTPTTFTTSSGSSYQVEADGYGSCAFSKWSDGVTSNPRSFTAGDSSLVYTAVYDCGGNTGGGGSGGSGTSTINISTVNSGGSGINGYYISLWQNGAQTQSCYSPCSFTVNDGQTYQVIAASYGSEAFSHWQNDGSTAAETVNVPSASSTIDLTAVYSP